MLRYEFEFDFELPALYPATAPEIRLPCLVGKTPKQYRGGMTTFRYPMINEAASVEYVISRRHIRSVFWCRCNLFNSAFQTAVEN